MDRPPPAFGIDATPLVTGHGMRGIGRYLDGLFRALDERAADWAAGSLGTLLAGNQRPLLAGTLWRTWRAPWRPQDLDPLLAAVADRLATRGRAPAMWHHTDPRLASSPLPMKKTVVTVYDLIPLRDPAVMAAIRMHRRFAYRRYLAMIRSGRGVIAISEATADDVVGLLGVPRDRIRVVPPRIVPMEPPAVGDVGTGRLRLLFVGVAEPHKRADLAIATLQELVRRGLDSDLTFVGMQPPRSRDRLVRLVNDAKLAERVRFAGRVDDVALSGLYAGSILLATSSVEGFGLPPVEALLAGGRVVAAPTPAYRESLGTAGVIAARPDPSSLADGVEAAASTPVPASTRRRLGERFGSRVVADGLRAAYEFLAAT